MASYYKSGFEESEEEGEEVEEILEAEGGMGLDHWASSWTSRAEMDAEEEEEEMRRLLPPEMGKRSNLSLEYAKDNEEGGQVGPDGAFMSGDFFAESTFKVQTRNFGEVEVCKHNVVMQTMVGIEDEESGMIPSQIQFNALSMFHKQSLLIRRSTANDEKLMIAISDPIGCARSSHNLSFGMRCIVTPGMQRAFGGLLTVHILSACLTMETGVPVHLYNPRVRNQVLTARFPCELDVEAIKAELGDAQDAQEEHFSSARIRVFPNENAFISFFKSGSFNITSLTDPETIPWVVERAMEICNRFKKKRED